MCQYQLKTIFQTYIFSQYHKECLTDESEMPNFEELDRQKQVLASMISSYYYIYITITIYRHAADYVS